jgi:hypothetical protein
MSAWVLVIVLGVDLYGRSVAAITVDMPNEQACYLALNKALSQKDVKSAFCLTRNP